MADHTPTPQNSTGSFGIGSLTCLVVASMIGSGIFTTSGFTLASLGTPTNVMICWAVGGVIAVCGALAFGRLATLMPQSGGEYLYLSRHLHPLAGFLAGWVSLIAGFSGAIAIAAIAFEAYALPADLRPKWLPPDVVAIVAILFFGAAHGVKSEWGRSLQNMVVVLKLVALIVFLAVATLNFQSHTWHVDGNEAAAPVGMQWLTQMANSLVWISLSYMGFNAAIYVAGESKDASKTVPKALLRGTLLVTLLYLLLNLVFVTAAPFDQLAGNPPVATLAAAAIGGLWLERLIRWTVCLGLLSSISGMVMSGPRVYSRMADDGVFPAAFSVERKGINKSIALQAAIAIGLILLQRILVNAGVLTSSLLGLFDYLGTTLSLSSACCIATLFLPGVRRKFTTSNVAADVAALLYVVATVVLVVLMAANNSSEGSFPGIYHLSGAAITVVTGVVAWRVFRR
ncbi:MAG: APC family permease [Fuerstiella sp.]